jgi:hypothetical protein
MDKRKKAKGQKQNTTQKTLKIEQHEPTKNRG